jgi:hypothetical protein
MQPQKFPKLLAKAEVISVATVLHQQVLLLLQMMILGLLQMQVQAGLAQMTKLPFKKEEK